MSGHYFYRGLEGGDDGLYTACLLIAHLARSSGTLAELRRACPPVYMTPDLRVSVAPGRPAGDSSNRSARRGRSSPSVSIDGVRIDMPGGWALVRSSVTEPALTFRFEGLDWHALGRPGGAVLRRAARVRRRVVDALPSGDGQRGTIRARRME